jgi:hypothetical protein
MLGTPKVEALFRGQCETTVCELVIEELMEGFEFAHDVDTLAKVSIASQQLLLGQSLAT